MPTLVPSKRVASTSVEFLRAWVDSASNGEDGATLSSQAVAFTFTTKVGSPSEDATWRGATWIGSPGTARAATILIGPGTSNVIAKGSYNVYARVTDTPEIPVVLVGRLTVY